jgi:hypothetical protein
MLTSPSNRRILKLLLLIFNWGEPGKQLMQLVRVYTMSRKYCAIATAVWSCVVGDEAQAPKSSPLHKLG